MDDATHFDRLFRIHSEGVFRFCLRRTGNWALAEDLRSMVFVEAWRRRSEVDLVTRDPLPWLYGVALNVVRNERRAQRREAAAFRRFHVARIDGDATDEIVERVDAHRRARVALALIEALPPAERDVVTQCLDGTATYQTVAARLDLPIGTVRSRLFRARARMRERDPPANGGWDRQEDQISTATS